MIILHLVPLPPGERLGVLIAGDGVDLLTQAAGTSQRIDLDGEAATNLSNAWAVQGRLTRFDVAFDGRRAAYTISAGGQEDLWVASIDRSSPQRLTNDPSFERLE